MIFPPFNLQFTSEVLNKKKGELGSVAPAITTTIAAATLIVATLTISTLTVASRWRVLLRRLAVTLWWLVVALVVATLTVLGLAVSVTVTA